MVRKLDWAKAKHFNWTSQPAFAGEELTRSDEVEQERWQHSKQFRTKSPRNASATKKKSNQNIVKTATKPAREKRGRATHAERLARWKASQAQES